MPPNYESSNSAAVSRSSIHMCNACVILLLLFGALAVAMFTGSEATVIAVVLACHRSSQLKKTLRSFAKNAPPQLADEVPVYVSVDDNPKAHRAIRAANGEPNVKRVWYHLPSEDYIVETTRDRIARHYHFALSKAFDSPEHTNVSHVILLEDDLLFAPDFLPYMVAATKHLSNPDNNAVVCASAWNDNGRNGDDPHTAVLTSFFPGLGWVLSRALWTEFLRPNWPGCPAAQTHGIVGVGWDFWLRVAFEARGWACITPVIPRVFHFGATGSNVGAYETAELFATSPLAKVPAGEIDWHAVHAEVTDTRSIAKTVQMRLHTGHRVTSIEDARKGRNRLPVMPYFRENFREAVADPLSLWPTPRGHFRHTMLVQTAAGKDLLLYDVRRAAMHFNLPSSDVVPPQLHLIEAQKNVSCDDACGTLGLRCTPASLEAANSCSSLSEVMSDSCRLGCAYETGIDLPARVEEEAPLQTAGMCLIAETGLGDNGSLDCSGRYIWTRRSCACVGEVESAMRDEL